MSGYALPTPTIDDTNILRACCCLLIILGHSAGVGNIHNIAVSMFFLLSGYGLYSQYMKNGKKYLDKFIRRKIAPLLMTYCIAMLLLLSYSVVTGLDVFWTKWMQFYVPFWCWFVWTISLFYLAFYLVMLKFGDDIRKTMVAIVAFTIVYTVFLLPVADVMCRVPLLFAVGMLYAYGCNSGYRMKRKHTWILFALPLMLVLADVLFMRYSNLPYLLTLPGLFFAMSMIYIVSNKQELVKSLISIALFCTCLFYLMIFGCSGTVEELLLAGMVAAVVGISLFAALQRTRLTSMFVAIGKNSYEIYLVQGMGLALAVALFPADRVMSAFVALVVSLLATIPLIGMMGRTKSVIGWLDSHLFSEDEDTEVAQPICKEIPQAAEAGPEQ